MPVLASMLLSVGLKSVSREVVKICWHLKPISLARQLSLWSRDGNFMYVKYFANWYFSIISSLLHYTVRSTKYSKTPVHNTCDLRTITDWLLCTCIYKTMLKTHTRASLSFQAFLFFFDSTWMNVRFTSRLEQLLRICSNSSI